jgi:aspartate kinase
MAEAAKKIVMKFGGTSVADIERIRNVGGLVAREVERGHQVAVVVSAMAGETNKLVGWVREVAPLHDAREYDVVVAAGEQITAGLLAIELERRGVRARSWMGWQIPIHTTAMHGAARIQKIDTEHMNRKLAEGQVAVVAGFQGIAPDNRIATLGRGGSDTSAVALAAALKADRCDIYTDVDGVYTADPRVVSKARRLTQVSYEEMLELASQGAKVLQTRSVEMAMVHHVKLRVLSTFDPDGTGTTLCDEEDIVEKNPVTGIACSRDEAKITLFRVPHQPGIAAAIFGPLADAGINVDMIAQAESEDGRKTNMTFTTARADLGRAVEAIEKNADKIGYKDLVAEYNVAKVSIVGVGMRSHVNAAQAMFRALAEKGINIQAISTSEIKVSVLIAEDYVELAMRTLHAEYNLDVG